MKHDDQQKLWPIVESCGDIGPLGLAVLNIGGVLAVSTPFLMVLGGLCVGLWLANLAGSGLLEMFGISARLASIAAYTIKIPLLLFAGLLLRNLVPHVPALVQGARKVILEDDV